MATERLSMRHTREILRTRDTINQLYADHTGQSVDAIKRDTERDRFMNATQSLEYGLVDEVLATRVNIGTGK